jgi:putative transposase
MTELNIEIVLQTAVEKYPDKKPSLISDNGSQYISKEFQLYIKEVGVKTSPSYPQKNSNTGQIKRRRKIKLLDFIKFNIFATRDEAETGSAGEQLVRNSLNKRNK